MSSWALPALKPPCIASWSTSSIFSASRERGPNVGCGLSKRSHKQEILLPVRHYSEVPGPRAFPHTTKKGNKRISKLDGRTSSSFPSRLRDDVENQEVVVWESPKGTDEDLRSPKPGFAPFRANLLIPSRGRSNMNHKFAGGDLELPDKGALRRLNSVGAADKSERFRVGLQNGTDSFRCTSFDHCSEEILALRKGRYPGREQVCNEEGITTNSDAVTKGKVSYTKHEEQGRWARRSLLTYCIPGILERLGFNFFKNLARNQGLHNRYNINVTVSSEMEYQFLSQAESEESLHLNDTQEHFLKHDGKLHPVTSDSARQVMVPDGRRPGIRGSGRSPERLWLQADGDTNAAQSTMWTDMFTIFGLSAFITCGTYAFAMSNRYLKLGSKNKCPSMAARSPCGSDSHSAPYVRQLSVIELTSCNFESSVSKKATFVLFYAPWCSHCQQLEHTWKDLSCRLPKRGFDVQLAQLDAEKYSQVAEKYKVMKYPTLIFFRNGKAMENHTGPRDVDSLIKFIDENYSA